ncbi:MAG TPA: lamin tail domain-containing protein [Anaerolineaceae bacterium]
MNQGRRLLFYIVLNIFISACVTLAVLWLWDRNHQQILPQLLNSAAVTVPTSPAPTAPAQTSPTADPAAGAATLPGTTSTPAPSPSGTNRPIVIDNVFGVGNLKDEYVLIKLNGDSQLDLTKWRLDDGNGNTYTFPAITLYNEGAVQVHTAGGVDTVVDLYWGRTEAVWQEGKIVTLYDDKGSIRATYRIP